MRLKWMFVMVLFIIAVCLGVSLNNVRAIDNFKCTNQARYRIMKNASEYDFQLTQTIQLYEDKAGFISFNGKVVDGTEVKIINRKIILEDGYKIDNHTFKYHNRGIRRLPTDQVDDDVFQILLAEVSGDDATLIFEREKIDKNAWLIGNPDSWVLTCVEY